MVVKDWQGTHHVDLGGNVLFLHEDKMEEIRDIIIRLKDKTDEYSRMKKIANERGMITFSYEDIAKRSIR